MLEKRKLGTRGLEVSALGLGCMGMSYAYGEPDEVERLGTPDDIAGVVCFLAGPDGGWVNGQVLRANGGYA
jgi:NAD(P)-dependent dehydrogenase (short-subunit alcohol dehydrogenase family)